MCRCSPTSSTEDDDRARSTASAACPVGSGKPNLESRLPVRTCSWVWTSMPGLTRSSTVGRSRPAGHQRLDAVQLVVAVHDDAADAELQGLAQLRGRLVVAVQHQSVRRDAGRDGDVQLAARRHVQPQALLVHESGHGAAQEGLGGVDDTVGSEHGRGLPAAGPEVGLVVDEQRGPVLLRQVQQVDAPDRQTPVGSDDGGVRQQAQGQGVHGRPAHMLSGAETPRRSSPTRRPTPAAPASHHRAWRRSSGVSGLRMGQSW